jgi:hypothetical protein
MSVSDDTPNSPANAWLRDALGRFGRETGAFGRTFAAFAFHPGRSAEKWQSGERTFMNPLGFVASAAAIYWAVSALLIMLWPTPASDTSGRLADQFASAVAPSVGPYVHYGLLGLAMHVGLRGLGSRRSLLGSLGVAFFVGGTVGTVTALLLSSTARWVGHTRGTSQLDLAGDDPVALVFLVAAVACYVLVCWTMAVGLIGLTRAPLWKAMLAGGFAIALTALLFGSALVDASLGWRPYLEIDLRTRQFGIGFLG